MAKTGADTGDKANGAQRASVSSTDVIEADDIVPPPANAKSVSPPPEKPVSPRRRGRPPGRAKTGGRVKGVKPLTHPEVRDALLGKSDAITVLADIVAGRQLRVSGPTGRPIWRYPTLQERLSGLKMLLDKCVPSLVATELSGPGSEALFRPGVDDADNRQMARAVVALLAGGVTAVEDLCEPTLSSPWSPRPDEIEARFGAY